MNQTRLMLGLEKWGSLSKDVFEWRTSAGSEAFSLFICLDANKFLLLSFFSLIKTIHPRVSTKPLPCDAKSPLPVEVRRSKTLLLKLNLTEKSFSTIDFIGGHWKGKGRALGRRCALYSFLRYTSPLLPLLPQMQTYWKHNILVETTILQQDKFHFIFCLDTSLILS